MKHWMHTVFALAAVPALAACGGDGEAPEVVVEQPAGGMEGTEGMKGMEGMGGMPMSGGMLEQMQAHMQMMGGEGGDVMMERMPQHRQMVANMLSQMNREMRDMKMGADPQWEATVDSLRQDLTSVRTMNARELEDFMPGHRARVMRLMEMHRAMMAGMGS